MVVKMRILFFQESPCKNCYSYRQVEKNGSKAFQANCVHIKLLLIVKKLLEKKIKEHS